MMIVILNRDLMLADSTMQGSAGCRGQQRDDEIARVLARLGLLEW